MGWGYEPASTAQHNNRPEPPRVINMWLMLAIINGILAVITQDTIPTILFSMCTICAYLERIEAAVKSKTTGPSAKKKVMDTELTGSGGR